MTQPATTVRLLIVCIPTAYRLVNDTLLAVDPSSTGDNITVRLRLDADSTNVERAFIGSWALTDAHAAALKDAIRTAGWQPKPTLSEQTVWNKTTLGSLPALSSGQRVWVFEGEPLAGPTASSMTYDEVKAALGLASYRFVL